MVATILNRTDAKSHAGLVKEVAAAPAARDQLVYDIEAHPYNSDIVYIVQNQKVYRSGDRGQKWDDISGSLPSVNMYDIAFYSRNSTEALYVASNLGVFFMDENMDDWVHFSDGLPAAIWASEIEIFYHADNLALDKIKASSYGRGLWDSSPYYYEPTANFFASDTILPLDCSIDFYDMSSGYPHTWSWTFEGGTPSTSSDQNPTDIQYSEEGVFEVSLTVSNPSGTDTKTITAYITVDEAMMPQADFVAGDTVSFQDGLDKTIITKRPATLWWWCDC